MSHGVKRREVLVESRIVNVHGQIAAVQRGAAFGIVEHDETVAAAASTQSSMRLPTNASMRVGLMEVVRGSPVYAGGITVTETRWMPGTPAPPVTSCLTLLDAVGCSRTAISAIAATTAAPMPLCAGKS